MTGENPMVSIVLPTYNRADIIGDSIQSVLNQSYENFELLVVDDASTDNTKSVVEGFEDDRVRYLRHERNKGAPEARNTGLDASKGPLIGFQDSDDEWHREKLLRQVEAFREAPVEVGVVYTGMKREENDELRFLPYKSVDMKEGDIRPSLARYNFISTPVALVRKHCFDEVGQFDEDAWPLSDWELWIRISKRFEFRFVDETLVFGEVRPDSISTDQAGLVRARSHIITKHKEFFDASSMARHLFYIGHGSMKLDEREQARQYFRKAVQTNLRPTYVSALLLSSVSPGLYDTLYHVFKRANRVQ